MGINKLFDFLRKKAPNVFKTVPLSNHAGKKVAVDIPGFIFKYMLGAQKRKTNWLDSFTYLILALVKNQIHPIFVFEGKAPIEKKSEREKRENQKQTLIDAAYALRVSLDNYYDTGVADEVLQEEMKKELLQKVSNASKVGRVAPLPASMLMAGSSSLPIDTVTLERRYDQKDSQILKFSGEETDNLIELFKLCGIQYMKNVPCESESMCSSMANQGIVDAVVSNDSDVCAYGVKTFLYDLNPLTETCVEINYDSILKELNLTRAQFLDFCIMCGTDYNDNIPGVGPVNAYKLIKQYGSIDALPSNIDRTILNHTKSREVFQQLYPFEGSVLSVTPKSTIDIHSFLVMKNSRVKLQTIQNAFKPPEIIFLD